MKDKPIRVLVADSHERVHQGLTLFVDIYHSLELVGVVKDTIEALNLCATYQPDVVLVSLEPSTMGGLDAPHLTRQTYPQIRVIFMSHLYIPEEVQTAILAGASSYMVKSIPIEEIAKVIRATMT